MISACTENQADELENLLQGPINPDLTDEHGRTPLHHAARNGHLKCGSPQETKLGENLKIKRKVEEHKAETLENWERVPWGCRGSSQPVKEEHEEQMREVAFRREEQLRADQEESKPSAIGD
eukprot:Skav223783  [mRNA]  locus=scaffold575:157007:163820:+ [translate_table: standard]